MKFFYSKGLTVVALILSFTTINAQNVGINTTLPQAQLHVVGDSVIFESGQFGNQLVFSLEEFNHLIKSMQSVVLQVDSSKVVYLNPGEPDAKVIVGSYQINNNAIFKISSNNKGILIPRLVQDSIDAIPLSMADDGLLVFNSTSQAFNVYANGAWQELSTTAGSGLWSENVAGEVYRNSNVGINTNDPVTDLHVQGGRVLLESPDGTKQIMMRVEGADGELKSLNDLYLRAEGDDVLINHVPTDGNVAIGKSNPQQKLDVGGAIQLDAATTPTTGTIQFTGTDFEGYDGTTWRSLTNGTGGVGEWTTNGSGEIYRNSNVGINTNDPVTDLHVQGGRILLESPDGTKQIMMRVEGADGELKSLNDLYLRAEGDDVLINHVPTDGNVAIGKSNPQQKLDVGGAIQLDAATTPTTGTIQFTGTDFEGYDGTTWQSLTSVDDADADPANETISTATLNGNDLEITEAGVLVSVDLSGLSPWNQNGTDLHYDNGNVGIGTISPEKTLHVESPDVNGGLRITRAGTPVDLDLKANGAEAAIGTTTDHPLRFLTNNTVRVAIENNGNMGIGTTSPSEKLEVNGNVRLGATNPILKFSEDINFNSSNSDSAITLITPNNATSGGNSTLFFAEDDDGTFGMGLTYDGGTNVLGIYGKANTSIIDSILLVKRDNGQVSIGGSFANGYKLSVDGKAICEELQVELKSGWPDYVFQDGYNLMPLAEVEKFIDTNGHLPGLNKDEEYNKNGVSVGEMTRIQMEKIEEIMLHLIQLEKENKELKHRISELENKGR